MILFAAPHQDDEALFGAYTLIRFKPVVYIATRSEIQRKRDGITNAQRTLESVNACQLAGCGVRFGECLDTEVTIEAIISELRHAAPELVFAPAIQGGNKHHDIIGNACDWVFGKKVIHYSTYTKDDLHPRGNIEIIPSIEEIRIKNAMLDCYTSQHKINAPHFDAVRNKSEYWIA